MLHDLDLPKHFWAKAIWMAVFINNCAATKANQGLSPYEVWTGCKPDLTGLHIFSCTTHLLVPAKLRNKLQPHSHNTIYLGPVNSGSHHQLWMLESKTISKSHDVVFSDESEAM
jgi:hypothetical protein